MRIFLFLLFFVTSPPYAPPFYPCVRMETLSKPATAIAPIETSASPDSRACSACRAAAAYTAEASPRCHHRQACALSHSHDRIGAAPASRPAGTAERTFSKHRASYQRISFHVCFLNAYAISSARWHQGWCKASTSLPEPGVRAGSTRSSSVRKTSSPADC